MYVPSRELTQLGADAETDEERELWAELRAEIAMTIAERCGTPQAPRALGENEEPASSLAFGAKVYNLRCSGCHGATGDGAGVVAEYLTPRPRDFRKGVFKFTSTPYGAKPLRADLIRTVQRGVPGASMPSFKLLAKEEIEAVVDYVIALAQRGKFESELVFLAEDEEELDAEYVAEIADEIVAEWSTAQPPVKPVTPMLPMTAESVAEGRALFLQHGCSKCHGADGRGGLAGGIDVGKDVWGHTDPAADLTSGMFRGGERPIDIYRRISSGINGTPMPSFANVFQQDPDAMWRLVHFVLDVGEQRRLNRPPQSGDLR